MPGSVRTGKLTACALVLAGAIVPHLAADGRSCGRWQYERIELGMPLTVAARVHPPTAAPLSWYRRQEHRGLRGHPWNAGGGDATSVVIDHDAPGEPIVGIRASTRAEGGRRLPEFLWWWPSPHESNETDHVRQYVWHDVECGVRATLTFVVANDRILISIVKDDVRATAHGDP